MPRDYIEAIKEKLSDLPDTIHGMVDEYFKMYVDSRMEQGHSMSRIENNLTEPEEMAERFRFFYRLHQVYGRRRLKGAGRLIREALQKGVLSRQLYSQRLTRLIILSLFLLAAGAILTVLGGGLSIGNLDNPRGLNASVVLLSVFIFVGGLGCIYYIVILTHKFRNEMLSAAMDGCNLRYFGT
jgi:uncharacterized membrane protein